MALQLLILVQGDLHLHDLVGVQVLDFELIQVLIFDVQHLKFLLLHIHLRGEPRGDKVVKRYRLLFLLDGEHGRVGWQGTAEVDSMAWSRDHGRSICGTHRGFLLLLLVIVEFIDLHEVLCCVLIYQGWRLYCARLIIVKVSFPIGRLVYVL